MPIKKVKYPVSTGKVKSINTTERSSKIDYKRKAEKVFDLDLYPFKLKEQDLLVWDDQREKYISVSKAVKINSITRCIETRDIEVELVFWAFDRCETVVISRGDLSKRELKKLASKGLDVLQDKQASAVATFLNKQEKTINPTNVHKGMGWDFQGGQLVYKHYELIAHPSNSTKSNYIGDYDIEPRGDYYDYLNLLAREVMGKPALQLMLCVAMSSLIIGMLNRTNLLNLDTLLVHIYGASTTGKTTAAMLGVSAAGAPTAGGLLQSYNGTRNAIAKKLVGNYGVPIVLDESTMNLMDMQNFSSFIYEIAQNTEKTRLTKESELKDSQSWSTTIISTGESSILAKSNKNEGLRVRLFEFSLDKWTKDGKNAENLKKGILNSYGHIAPKIAKKMIELGPEKVAYMLEDNKMDLLKILPESKFKDRIATKLALVITAAELIELTLEFELEGEEIIEMLIDQELKAMSDREMAPKFYRELKQHIIRFRRNFKINKEPVASQQEIWGKIETSSNQTQCYILPVIFDQIARDYGYSDSKVLIDALKKEGLILHDKNKNQKRKFIFSKGEIDQREELLGQSGYPKKGDYTYCICYEGNILEDGF
ncbi:uncharacterized protein (DUF927 family) [Bacillus sp. V-88]|nr:hypothetical protein B1B00_09715 [Bacillus sp. DSM 27956]PRX76811.1 uncharacterized protein (DUF927 family) [Bacillus sp. V-88]SLK22035.1 Uncharcterized protein, DUF927 family [Bacillus sp. V-88]